MIKADGKYLQPKKAIIATRYKMKTAKEFLEDCKKYGLSKDYTESFAVDLMEEYAKYVLGNQPEKPSKKKRQKQALKKLRKIADEYEGKKEFELNYWTPDDEWRLIQRPVAFAPGAAMFPCIQVDRIIHKMGSQMDDLLL